MSALVLTDHPALDALERETASAILGAAGEAELEQVRVAALGKKGTVSELLKSLGSMSPDERKVMGPAINGLRDRVQGLLAARKEALKAAALDARLATERLDVTLPVRETAAERGRIHPIAQVTEELTAIFADMGFSVAEGPDIETDFHNFTALNFPAGHPAREMHDTFFLPPNADGERMVLRTHTCRCRCAPCSARSRRSASSARAAPIAATRTRPTPPCSIRWRAGDRQGFPHGPPQVDPGGILQGVLRGGESDDAFPPVLLPLH